MAKVSQTIEINASPQACYDVITDYESYPDFLPETKAIQVGKKSGNTAEVTFTIEVIKKVSYTLKMVGKPPKSVSWSMIKGEMMKSNDGGWDLEEVKSGVTKATYSIDVNLGLLVPGAVSKMLIGSNLPTMLKAFKQRIESKSKKKK
jgi:coenzyme Q-binding protein COQ10